MPIELPTYQEIVDRIRSDIRAQLPDLDPSIFGSMIRAISDSNAGRHYDNVLSLVQLEKELFPQTANLQNLELWAAYEGLTPFPAEQSAGAVIFTGTVASTIADLSEFRSLDGNIYIADGDGTISAQVISVTLTRSGSIVTATAASAHNLASGLSVVIAGANETDYNGTFDIIVTSSTIFTYTITGTPATPATGTITAACDCVSIDVVSEDFGLIQNLDSGAQLQLVQQIAGVNNEGYVGYAGLIGGKDIETKESLLTRTIQSRANPVANFNIAAITKAALGIQGVTRVKVKRITPRIGAVTILFVRDGDDNIIPSASEVTEVETAILELLQATSEESDVVVTAPTPVATAFSFSSITPSTATMQAAIIANIHAFYEDEATFETNITEDQYRAAIINTIDPDTGDSLTAFTLASPAADITITTDEIGIPGGITF